MINAIGAFIVTLLFISLLIRRPKFRIFESQLASTPIPLVGVVALLLLCLIISHYGRTSSMVDLEIPYISYASFLLATLSLWIHEAGHWYLSWTNQLIHSLGGTIFELGVPLAFGAFCLYRCYVMTATLFFFWTGFNMLAVGQYMSDAQQMALPLLGGSSVSHDWNVIFSELGLLEVSSSLGFVTHSLGFLIAFTSIGYFVYRRVVLVSQSLR